MRISARQCAGCQWDPQQAQEHGALLGLLHLPAEDDRAISFWHYLKPAEEMEGPISLDVGASYCGWMPACTPASVLPPVLEKGVFSSRKLNTATTG